MVALHRATEAGDYPAGIVGVLSDRAGSGALDYAAANGLPHAAVSRERGEPKPTHEARIERVLRDWRAEIVCLAGYMRVLSGEFVTRWRGRLINIHPSLLPAFPGLDTHARVLARGCRVHGCTVHFVTEGVDEGPIIDQAWLAVDGERDPDRLAARVLALEHELYPHALAAVARGEATLAAQPPRDPADADFTRP